MRRFHKHCDRRIFFGWGDGVDRFFVAKTTQKEVTWLLHFAGHDEDFTHRVEQKVNSCQRAGSGHCAVMASKEARVSKAYKMNVWRFLHLRSLDVGKRMAWSKLRGPI
jgi:hypothetical protein